MSRRETIIVALVVNVALLVVLFATAVRSDGGKRGAHPEALLAQAAPTTAPPAKIAPPPSRTDSLENYVTSLPTLAETADESLSFTEELKLAFVPQTALAPVVEEKVVAAAPSVAREAGMVEVVVKKGDFLEKIASAHQTSVAALMQANHLTSTQLKIGQVLKVPSSKGGESPQKKGAPPAAGEGSYYIVREGDNPWLIASRNNLRLDDLLRLNGLDEQKARRLRPGDRLKIR